MYVWKVYFRIEWTHPLISETLLQSFKRKVLLIFAYPVCQRLPEMAKHKTWPVYASYLKFWFCEKVYGVQIFHFITFQTKSNVIYK